MKTIRSFKSKILIATIALLLFCLILLTSLSYFFVSSNSKQHIDTISNLKLKILSDSVFQWTFSFSSAINQVAPDFSVDRRDLQIQLMVKQIQKATSSKEVIVAFKDGRSYNSESGIGNVYIYDPRQEPWFKAAEESKELTIYSDDSKFEVVVPFYYENKHRGVIKASRDINELHNMLMKAEQSSVKISLTNHDGKVLYSSGLSSENGLIINEVEEINLNDNKNHVGTSNIAIHQESIEILPNMTWHLRVETPNSLNFRSLTELTYNMSLLTLTTLIIGASFMYRLLNYLCKPLTVLSDMIHDLASDNSDLTSRIPLPNETEFSRIANNVNKLAEKLHKTVTQIKSLNDSLHRGAKVTSNDAANLSNVSKKQLNKLEMLSVAMEELSASSHSVAEIASQASVSVKATQTSVSNGRNVIDDTRKAILSMSTEITDAAQVIEKVQSNASDIEHVMSVIEDIADQTNLLALNAAIEAARAGESGRGFAVVADEVRSLAQRTQESTSLIQDSVVQLRDSAMSASKVMNESISTAQITVSKGEASYKVLDIVDSSVQVISNLIKETETAAEEQKIVASEVNANTSYIKLLSEDVAGSAQKTRANMKEQMSLIQAQNDSVTSFII